MTIFSSFRCFIIFLLLFAAVRCCMNSLFVSVSCRCFAGSFRIIVVNTARAADQMSRSIMALDHQMAIASDTLHLTSFYLFKKIPPDWAGTSDR